MYTYSGESSEYECPAYIDELLKQGKLGDKAEEGLYRIKENQVYDIKTKEYREIKKYDIEFIDKVIENFKVAEYEKGIQVILKENSDEGKICRRFLIDYLISAITISKEVAYSITDCDIAMAEGFNWIPPFALMEVIGKKECRKIALDELKYDKEIINDVFEYEVNSKYRYEKFLKAKR